MAEFQYTTVPGKIGPLFNKIRSVGVPAKATTQWLKAIGFTSSNDASLLTIVKAIGFSDQSGSPTDAWKQYRGNQHKAVIANAIRTGYRSLFDVYSDAWERTDKDLEHFFSTHSTAGEQVVSKTVSTFKSLAVLGDFSAESPPVHRESRNDGSSTPSGPPSGRAKSTPTPGGPAAHGPSVHLDIQIHISPESTPEQIEQIFASMAKHLYERRDG